MLFVHVFCVEYRVGFAINAAIFNGLILIMTVCRFVFSFFFFHFAIIFSFLLLSLQSQTRTQTLLLICAVVVVFHLFYVELEQYIFILGGVSICSLPNGFHAIKLYDRFPVCLSVCVHFNR